VAQCPTDGFGSKLIDSQESFARAAVFLATCIVGVVLWPRAPRPLFFATRS
jgi:hypothetical protein